MTSPVAATIAVEPATASGVDELLRLSGEYALSLYPPESSFLLTAEQLMKPGVRVYLARSPEGEALGMAAIVDEAFAGAQPGEAELKRMFVRDEARGQRLAARLLETIEADARARGIRRIVLETGPYNAMAITLYEREGYARIPLYGQYLGELYSLCYAKALDD